MTIGYILVGLVFIAIVVYAIYKMSNMQLFSDEGM